MKLKHKILLPILAVLLILSGVTLAVFASDPEATTATGGSLDVWSCNLSFRSNVCIKYAIATEDASVKMLIWRAPQSEYTYGSQAAILNPVGTDTIDEKNCLIFDYTELAAADMTEVVYARAFTDNGDGTYTYGAVKKYSILQYAYNKLGYTATASTDENLKQMLRDMLVYGASAQKYLDRNTDRLATADFYQVVVEGGLLADGCTDGLYLPGESVTLIAPETNAEGQTFSHWENAAYETVGKTATFVLTVPTKHDTYTAVYETVQYSQGLAFTSNGDGTCYVSGIGTCADTDVKIPPVSPDGDSVTSIGGYAFSYCSSLTSITIPASVTSIGYEAFSNCSSLTSIIVDEGNTVYHSAGNCLIETASKTLLAGCKTSVIPTDGSVTSIGGYAFSYRSSLTSITIPASVTRIGQYAFFGCSRLTSITFAEGSQLTSIGDDAFSRCSGLTSITIPASVTSIGGYAFSDCIKLIQTENGVSYVDKWVIDCDTSVTDVVLRDGTVGIGDYAFSGCSSLTSITIPASVTSIGSYAFRNCSSLTGITIPASVTSIGNGAFNGCSGLTNITFAEGSQLTGIGDSAFYDCSRLTSITIPESVTSIGSYAFSGCSGLTSITIPASVTGIGKNAFYGCIGLTSITIPASVTSIGSRAFYGCSGLTSVTFENTAGWYYARSSTATSGTAMFVTNPATNATNLVTTYYNYYWKRS